MSRSWVRLESHRRTRPSLDFQRQAGLSTERHQRDRGHGEKVEAQVNVV